MVSWGMWAEARYTVQVSPATMAEHAYAATQTLASGLLKW